MKRITIGLIVTVGTFIIGICAVAIWITNPPTNQILAIKVESLQLKSPSLQPNYLSTPKEAVDAITLCNRISEIKYLHPKGETGHDEIYDALIETGEGIVPCLIGKITDTTMMRDPRNIRISQEIKVGDVAYFVLIRITKLDFKEMLPEKVKQKYKTEGVYAYHDYREKG